MIEVDLGGWGERKQSEQAQPAPSVGAVVLTHAPAVGICGSSEKLVSAGGAPRFLDSVDRLFLWSSFRGEARQEVEGSLIPEG